MKSNAPQEQLENNPTFVVRPSKGWVPLRLKDLWQYRELFYFLTWRDIKVRYKQTVLGAAWAILLGNSSTLYRDYYKFHYGLTHNLLSLAVLIAPVNPKEFFPTRPVSVNNMAEFDLASRYFNLLPIPVPILLIGLLPDGRSEDPTLLIRR